MLRSFRAALPVLRTLQQQQPSRAATSQAEKNRRILEELVAAVKNPELIPNKSVSNFVWIDDMRRNVEKQKEWEANCKPLTEADRPVVPLNKYLYNIKIPDDVEVSPAVRTVLGLQTASNKELKHAEKRAATLAWQRRPGDSGSSEVQVALLTIRIDNLTRHMLQHRQDKHNNRGLMHLRTARRKMLQYIKREDFPTYRKLVLTLGLQPVQNRWKVKFKR